MSSRLGALPLLAAHGRQGGFHYSIDIEVLRILRYFNSTIIEL